MAEPISLNVGGVRYTTSMSTLTRYPDSMLGRMFCGDLPSTKDKEGAYFIDGDGQLFRFVLNFLRRNDLCLPQDFKELDLLKKEADFYQIQPLIEALSHITFGTSIDGMIVEISEWRNFPNTPNNASAAGMTTMMMIDAPARFFRCLSGDLPSVMLSEIQRLGGTPMGTQGFRPYQNMHSMGNGFVSVLDFRRELPVTRVVLEDRLRLNGGRLHSCQSYSDSHPQPHPRSPAPRACTSRNSTWFIPNSFLNGRCS